MSRFSNIRRVGVLAASAAVALVGAVAVAPTAGAAPATGPGWSVTPVGAGSWEVELRLPGPVPVRAAQPQLAVDGVVLGVAREDDDRRTLTVRTSEPRVARAGRVQLAWNGIVVGEETRALRHAAAAPTAAGEVAPTGELLGLDPGARGRFGVRRADYDLGDTAVRLPGLGGQAVEERAAVYLPDGARGPRPVVVFLHGRHQACFGGTDEEDFGGWPCAGASRPVPSHLGYGEAAEALASQGYAVASISADGVNQLDWRAEDGGAQARGELVLAHLDLLRTWAPLQGRLDLSNVGLMGHSRGGEGVVRAALLNAERPAPYGIRAVMPLAPVDFARQTLPGTAMAVVLPYCDGDVSDQQGQHFHDDTRYAAGDDVLRSSLLVMGANHNYFNSEWTPGVSQAPSNDDWFLADDPVCGDTAPGRLSPAEQRAVGAAYVSGFFRLNLGGEQAFLPLFDGTGGRAGSAGRAVVHTQAQQPSSARSDLATLGSATRRVSVPAGAFYCASVGLPEPGQIPRCASEQRPVSSFPHWTPAAFAPTVPATPLLRARWSAGAAPEPVTVRVPRGAASGVAQALTFRAATPRTVATDLTVTATDTAGRSAAVRVSRFSDALRPLPAMADPWGGEGDPVAKTWLRTVRLPLDAFAGVDVGRLASVTFTPVGRQTDVYLSDVALDRPASGTGAVPALPAVSIGDAEAFEDDGTQRVRVPLTLSKRSAVPVTVEVDTALAALDGRIAPAWTHVTIPAGSLTGSVVVPLVGDDLVNEVQARFTVTLSVPREAVVGDGFGTLTVYDDDLYD